MKMDLGEVRGGWRMELTDCRLQHRLWQGSVEHLVSAVMRLLYFVDTNVNYTE